MRKCLPIVALLLGVICNKISAQSTQPSLFDAPDTVCVDQPVFLTPKVDNAQSFYWGFCTGSLQNTPVSKTIANTFGFTSVVAVEVAKDGDNYYAFVLSTVGDSLYRLSFGNSYNNAPTITNFGSLSTTVPAAAHSLYMIQDNGNFHLFATGGDDANNSSIARFDFGTSLSNTPNSVNFGNLGGLLNAPHGIFVTKEASGSFFGYVVNRASGELIRLSFGGNLSLTPIASNLLNPGNALIGPTDIGAIMENGDWYLLVTNGGDNSLARIEFGNSLANVPTGVNLGLFANALSAPSGISLIRDCGMTYAFVANGTGNNLVRFNIPSLQGTYTTTTISTPFNNASNISRVIRQRDTLFAFVPNQGNGSLNLAIFPTCTSVTITSSDSAKPPVYEYTKPGRYTVRLAIDEGLPTARTECKEIQALPIPGYTLSPDTAICQGDTIELVALISGSLGVRFTPNYNLDIDTSFFTPAYPRFTTQYTVTIPFANGCIIDTTINITVHKNHADAGRDRLIADGTSTTLGGPLTTIEQSNTYMWTPNQFLNDGFSAFTVAKPAYDITYYLTVTDTNGCIDIDTVVVRLSCEDLHLPNAFAPEARTNTGVNTFGILNKSIIKLNYFRIYDRWGKLMFETEDPTKEWDGNYNGEKVPIGVYVWDADGFCTSGKRIQNSGSVTLIR